MKVLYHHHKYDKIGDILFATEEISQRIEFIKDRIGISSRSKKTRFAIYGSSLSGMLAWFGARYHNEIPYVLESSADNDYGNILESEIVSIDNSISEIDAILLATAPVHYPNIIDKIGSYPLLKNIPVITLWSNTPEKTQPTINTISGNHSVNLHYGYFTLLSHNACGLLPYFDNIQKQFSESIGIYGAGLSGILTLHALKIARKNVTVFFDGDTGLNGKQIYHVPVYPIEKIDTTCIDRLMITLSPSHKNAIKKIVDSLKDKNIAVDILFSEYSELNTVISKSKKKYILVSGLGGGGEGICYHIRENENGRDAVLKAFHNSIKGNAKDAIEKIVSLQYNDKKQMLPKIEIFGRKNEAIVCLLLKDKPSIPIPKFLFSNEKIQKFLLKSYFMLQSHLICFYGVFYIEPLSHYNFFFDKKYVKPIDIGSGFILMQHLQPHIVRQALVISVAELRPDIFPGRPYNVASICRQYLYNIEKKLENAHSCLPDWLLRILKCILETDDYNLLKPETYKVLESYCDNFSLSSSRSMLSVSDNLFFNLPCGVSVFRNGIQWYIENFYQEFLYCKNRVSPIGSTTEKLSELLMLKAFPFQNRSYMDIGSNAGFFVLYAKLDGATYCTGIDLTFQSIRKGQRIAEAVGISDICFQQLALPDKRIEPHDVVSAFSILHHLYFQKNELCGLKEIVIALESVTKSFFFVDFVSVSKGNAYNYPTDDENYNESIFRNILLNRFASVRWTYPEYGYRNRRLYMCEK